MDTKQFPSLRAVQKEELEKRFCKYCDHAKGFDGKCHDIDCVKSRMLSMFSPEDFPITVWGNDD